MGQVISGSRQRLKSAFTSEQGFTIVELMIVVGIVGMLSAIAIPSYQKSADRARMKTLEALLVQGNTYMKTLALNADDPSIPYPSTLSATGTYSDWIVPTPGHAYYTPCSGLAPALRDICEFLPALPASTPNPWCCAGWGSRPSFLYRGNGLNYKIIIHTAVSPQANQGSSYSDPNRPNWAISRGTPWGNSTW